MLLLLWLLRPNSLGSSLTPVFPWYPMSTLPANSVDSTFKIYPESDNFLYPHHGPRIITFCWDYYKSFLTRLPAFISAPSTIYSQHTTKVILQARWCAPLPKSSRDPHIIRTKADVFTRAYKALWDLVSCHLSTFLASSPTISSLLFLF